MHAKRRILFLCTGNCFRSQMAEAILRHVDPVRFEALSAGSRPAGFVHPLVVKTLKDRHIPIIGQRSQSWTEFVDQPLDLLITLCPLAAEEVCPAWPKRPVTVHWPVPDPSFYAGPPGEQLTLARRVADRLYLKIRHLAALDWEQHDAPALRDRLEQLADF